MLTFLASIFASTGRNIRNPIPGAGNLTPSSYFICSRKKWIGMHALAWILFGNSAWAGGGSSPVAVDDYWMIDEGQIVNIRVLDNDKGLRNTPISVRLASEPAGANVRVNKKSNRIRFEPHPGTSGTQTFTYRVSDSDGDTSLATVTVDIRCSSNCNTQATATPSEPASQPQPEVQPEPTTISLSWSPSTQQADGYLVYYGPSSSTSQSYAGSSKENYISLNIASNLGLRSGDPVCFRVSAYNASGTSAPSDAVCGTI